MRVNIETPYGENIFDLPAEKVSALIQQAFLYAENNNMPSTNTLTGAGFVPEAVIEEIAEEKEKVEEKPPRSITSQPLRRTRNDSLFGVGWRNQSEKYDSVDNEQRNFGKYMEGYRGFLYIKCPKCGKIKGFCTKNNIKEHTCECGHNFRLENLKPMYIHCKCGKDYKYYTNMDDNVFEYSCLGCGAPVDVRLNVKETAYVSVRESSGGGITNPGYYEMRKRYGGIIY